MAAIALVGAASRREEIKSGVLAPPGAWLKNVDCMERCQSGRMGLIRPIGEAD